MAIFPYGQPNYNGLNGYNAPVYMPPMPSAQPQMQPQQQMPTVPQLSTNILYVTSLEDAMARYANPNTRIMYVLQDESMIFEITTDAQGKKTPKLRQISEVLATEPKKEEQTINYVTQEQFAELAAKLEALEKRESITPTARKKETTGGKE